MSKAGAVAYVLTRFPALSETFVLREIDALAALGLDVRPISLRRPREQELVDDELRAWASRTRYAPMGYERMALHAAVRSMARSAAYRRAFATVALGARRRPRPWTTSVGVLPQAAWASSTLDRDVRWIHAHFATGASTVAYALSAITGLPFSFTPHAGDLFTTWYVDGLLKTKIEAARFVVAISEFNRQHLADVVGAAATEARFPLIRYGLPRHWFDTARTREPAADPPRILSVGRLVAKKGHLYLVRALGQLARAGVRFECSIVGDGPERETLEAAILRQGLTDRVHLVGVRSSAEVRKLMDAASLFVLAAVIADDGDRDGLPNVLIEAMARRVAVVTTNVTGVPELVRDGANGSVVAQYSVDALAKAIAFLIAYPDERARRATSGWVTVRQDYEISSQARRLLERFRPALD